MDISKLKKAYYKRKEYLVWYEDKDLSIWFSQVPETGQENIHKDLMCNCEIKKTRKKPFVVLKTFDVVLIDKRKGKEKTCTFTVEKDFTFDGATIPKFARVIGSNSDITFRTAACIHDALCNNHELVQNDRYFSTMVFERLLYVGGVNPVKRWFMKHSVDNFQKLWFVGW